MSKIALSPNASGTGTFTIAAPGTNTDRTATLPDASTTLVGTEEGQVPYVPLNDELLAATQGVWEARETGTREG